jgi:CheY-like chemotaxis protein
LHILLAEDNATNQRLATINLETWGHRVTVADNGEKAIAALAQDKFDLVLMDMQMPKMSGLEATAAIREQENRNGTPRVPIIAMTANAMAGDREICLDSGMDDYVTKPIRYNLLLAAMGRVLPGLFLEDSAPDLNAFIGQVPPAEAGGTEWIVKPDTFDRAALFESVGGDEVLLREIIGIFLNTDEPRLIAALDDAAAKRDGRALEMAAHALKGLLSELRAKRAAELARSLEVSGHNGEMGDLDARVAALISEMGKLKHQLKQLVKTPEIA